MAETEEAETEEEAPAEKEADAPSRPWAGRGGGGGGRGGAPLILGLAWFALGYTLFYYAVNILVDAYAGDENTPMNPAPLSVLIGLGDPAGGKVATPTRRGPAVTSGRAPRRPHNTGGFA